MVMLSIYRRRRAVTFILATLLFLTIYLLASIAKEADATDTDDPANEWFAQSVFPITTAAGNQMMPVVDGDIVLWKDGRSSQFVSYLYGKNLQGKKPEEYYLAGDTQLSFTMLSKYLRRLDIKNKVVAFQNYSGNWLLCIKNLGLDPENLNASPESCIATTTADNVAISESGDKVIFDGKAYENGIKLADFSTGNITVIDTRTYDTFDPEIFNSFAYWVSKQGYRGLYDEYVLKGAPLDGSAPAENLTGSGCGSSLSRNHVRKGHGRVVFAKRDTNSQTGWDIATPTQEPDSEDSLVRCNDPGLVSEAGDQQNPEVLSFDVGSSKHDLVVWEDNRNGNWDIYGKDLETGQEIAVCV